MGFAYPKEERATLVASDPARFLLPATSDLRYNWVCAHIATLTGAALSDLVVEAWTMVVPKSVAAAVLSARRASME